MKKRKVNIGDVFCIQLENKKYAYGQVAAESRPRCYIVFNFTTDVILTNIEPYIRLDNICMLTFTFDECLQKGIWQVIGNMIPPKGIEIPEYKTETLDGVFIRNYQGDIVRKATKEEEMSLKYFRYITTLLLESMVNHHFIKDYNVTDYEKELHTQILYKPIKT